MAALVTLASAAIAFPIAYYAARYAARGWTKALFYLAVMMPLWSSYLVKVYAWKLVLAKGGRPHLVFEPAGLSPGCSTRSSISRWWVAHRSPSSYIGMFIVFVYIWLPYMILPIQAALERVPRTSSRPPPISVPGRARLSDSDPAAGAPRRGGGLDLHLLADARRLHHPQIVGNSRLFIGQVVYTQQGTAGNIPLAAAFTMVPILVMGFYLAGAKRIGSLRCALT